MVDLPLVAGLQVIGNPLMSFFPGGAAVKGFNSLLIGLLIVLKQFGEEQKPIVDTNGFAQVGNRCVAEFFGQFGGWLFKALVQGRRLDADAFIDFLEQRCGLGGLGSL